MGTKKEGYRITGNPPSSVLGSSQPECSTTKGLLRPITFASSDYYASVLTSMTFKISLARRPLASIFLATR